MTSKRSLDLALTEPFLFLRTGNDSSSHRRRREITGGESASMLRGVLSLKVSKPMRVTSIEAEFIGESCTEWPEGIGSHRIELSEQKTFLHYRFFFYKAPRCRRALTVGPGASPAEDDTENEVDSSGSAERDGRRRFYRRLSADHGIFHRHRRSPVSVSPGPSLAVLPQGQVTSPDGDRSHGSPSNANSTGEVNRVQGSPVLTGNSPSSSRRHSTPNPTPPELPEIKASRRLSARLSLSGVLQDVKDMVRGTDSRQDHTGLLEPTSPPQRPGTASPDKGEDHRGRSRDRKGKSRMSIIGEALGLRDEKGGEGNGWQTFRSGTYNYPVSFLIPSTLPPSIRCDFGAVHYRLKATVHRPGPFSHRLTTTIPVVVICMPVEEVDDGDAIVVERQWDFQDHPQLRYLLSIGGRHFAQGSEIPWNIQLMPLNKTKLYRISIVLEERIEYHAHYLARHDAPRRLALLVIRPSTEVPKGAAPVPLLPILSPGANALDESGLLPYVDHPVSTANSVEDQASAAAAHLLSPDGPWHLHGSFKLPEDVVHISTKHPMSNTIVRHCLKFYLRVERGDENDLDSKGHKKQYDIIVEMPVVILSHHCQTEQSTLPRYEPGTSDRANVNRSHCSALSRDQAPIITVAGSSSPSPPIGGPVQDYETRAGTSLQFARLVAGFENERGEIPPPYPNYEMPPPPTIVVSSEDNSISRPSLERAEPGTSESNSSQD